MTETMTAVIEPEFDVAPPGAGPFYEVIDGQVVEPPEMGVIEIHYANLIHDALALFFARSGRIGRSYVEMLFRIRTEPNLQRRPDMAFVSYDRWPKDRLLPPTASWQVVPDLAVEVVSPNDLAVGLLKRLDDYFRAGVRVVWVVYPGRECVFVYTSLGGMSFLAAADTLDGGDVLPGFTLPLAELFEGAGGR
jgi:Uma2 family endonuclease